ncbi:MAG: nitrilase-related carbon-nitrogen hydrolase [Deltaproteobacteria bacterium]|nr:nitrilase-related carbon-nitrogen hydrolase [Deltaproteobacteria bacterium]MDZ4343902.1 nitrilase-related carbon-nitrogen hydrolase [Candidatus Binatia bacterium]
MRSPQIKARRENGCYVVAPNQVGNIYTGHSMVVDSFGRIVVDLAEREGIEIVDIDLNLVAEVREKLPRRCLREVCGHHQRVVTVDGESCRDAHQQPHPPPGPKHEQPKTFKAYPLHPFASLPSHSHFA